MKHAAVIAVAVALTGCASAPSVQDGYYPELVSAYRVDSGDRLRVIVFGQTDISNTYAVDQAGNLSLPLVGDVAARGRSTDQIEAAVSARLMNGFVRNPDVSVEVDRYRPFFAMGEVSASGQYDFVPGMTVQQAIAVAGGFTARADKHTIQVTRSMNGQVETARLKLTDPIRPGDTLYVRERHL